MSFLAIDRGGKGAGKGDGLRACSGAGTVMSAVSVAVAYCMGSPSSKGEFFLLSEGVAVPLRGDSAFVSSLIDGTSKLPLSCSPGEGLNGFVLLVLARLFMSSPRL